MPLSDAAVRALLEARCGDPFSILGMHAAGGVVEVRTFLREAVSVSVVMRGSGVVTPLTQRAAEGLFEGVIPDLSQPAPYDLEVRFQGGARTHRLRDPYVFWPQLSDFDLDLFKLGRHHHLGDVLGAHCMTVDGVAGVRFAVWAPNAQRASVVGDWNGFDGRFHPMRRREPYGVWELFIPGVQPGMRYKFELMARSGELRVKADPFARAAEQPPATASLVEMPDAYSWRDETWLKERRGRDHMANPMAIYECHLGSWMRGPEGGDTWPNYRVLAPKLIAHCKRFGFTHIEFLPLAQHPYEGSWGYQVTGQYAPNSRHGSSDDLRWMIDEFHAAGIGVLVDFVPAHFPKDDFALARFDGEACFEYGDPREGEHRTWGTCVFNFRRPEVRNFIVAAAMHWLRRFHIDGLRVDAVSSMLYRDYDRKEGEWVANEQGGNANFEAVSFLQELTATVHQQFPGVLMIAEESTAWQGVTAPTHLQGLGFDLKWNMGWMHDTLSYMGQDPVMRAGCHDRITFHQWYAYDDKWVLSLSHDEVVHGKRSLLDKMPGDYWRKLAQLRLLYGWQVGVPGRVLLFQGAEFGQGREWAWASCMPWDEAEQPERAALGRWLAAVLKLYASEGALHRRDDHRDGFRWVDCENRRESVLAFLRCAPGCPDILVACNFTPVPRPGYVLGVPAAGGWTRLLDSDHPDFGGSGMVNPDVVDAWAEARGVFPASLTIDLPPLGVVFLKGPAKCM
jgi:1,4-alpha-glucan branching enzyme